MSNDEPKLTIFVSSMIGPLWDERVIVEEAIRTGIPLARTWVFERAPASSEEITESYLARVRECDIYLLILGEDISDPVKAEYRTAVECSKSRLCFVQEGVERTEALEEFLPTLQADVKYATFAFSDETSLRREVLRAVRLEMVRGYKVYRLQATERLRVAQDIEVSPEIRQELISRAQGSLKERLGKKVDKLVEAGTRWGVVVPVAGMTLAGIITAALAQAGPGAGLAALPVFALAFLQQLSASIGGDLLAGVIQDVAKGEDPDQEAVLGALQEVLEKDGELGQLRALLEETQAIELATQTLIRKEHQDLLTKLQDEVRTNQKLFADRVVRVVNQGFERLEEGQRRIEQHLLEMAAPSRPPVPLRTRIPEPRAAHLVGRTEELGWLRQRLKAGDVAAIAGVRGIGGIGKTELAIAAVHELEDHFEGRVIWLDCGPNDVYAIQDRMAAAIGVTLESDDLHIRADALALAFHQQPPTLVVLDDIRRRHLADGGFAAIAPPQPPCALLVTSRRYDLPLPDQAIHSLDVLSPEQSEELLSNLLPKAWLDAEPEAAAIAELLEHIPLALTLAARRAERIARRRNGSAHQPLTTLLDELRARRTRVLDQGDRPDLSVVVTFSASYDDLDTEDQARLRRLGVFAHNEFPLPALQVVWGDDEDKARKSLKRLANTGLVEEIGLDTWWMHDLLREYAAEQLAQADQAEEEAARLAHAAYWRQYLGDIELRSVDDWRNLESQRPEVEQAADWLLSDWGRDPDLAAELAIAISQAFQSYTVPQWEAWMTAGLAAAEAGEQRNPARRLQRSLGVTYWQRGEVAQAERLLQASLSTARDLLEAATTEEETEAGQRGVAVTLGDIARLKAQGGDVAGALALHQERLDIFEQLGDVRSRAVTQCDLADLLRAQGQYDEAERLYRDSLEICQQIRDAEGTFALLARLGQLALIRGQPDEALPLLQEARRGFEQLGFAPWVAQVDGLLAKAQGLVLTLDDLIAMVRLARQGDHQAGQQAWKICDSLAQTADATQMALGRALQRILAGALPETALAALPDDLRTHVLEGLDDQA